MSRQRIDEGGGGRVAGDDLRRRLLAGAPVTERRLELAGVSTAVLEGGEGPPVVLLHGQGGWAGMWVPVMAELVGRTMSSRPTCRASAPHGRTWDRQAPRPR